MYNFIFFDKINLIYQFKLSKYNDININYINYLNKLNILKKKKLIKINKINNYNIYNNKYNFLFYKVLPGDTLYCISFITKFNYKYIAKINNIDPPYLISAGRILKIYDNVFNLDDYNNFLHNFTFLIKLKNFIKIINNNYRLKNIIKFRINIIYFYIYNYIYSKKLYLPIEDKYFLKNYIKHNDGVIINIYNNKYISSIYDGYVLYIKHNFNNYKNILIIKHTNDLISIYINSNKILVKENQKVYSKQKISTVNYNNINKFYFEIKFKEISVDPIKFILN